MNEESLQILRKQFQELEEGSKEFAALIKAHTASFDKIKKLTQENLDRKMAEILRTDDRMDSFVEKTKKDFENFVKALEGKEAKQNVQEKEQRIKAVEGQAQEKEDINKKFSKEKAIASLNKSGVYGDTNAS